MPKIAPRTYKLMWDAHSATGIIIGLALFVIFFTGTLLLFRGEIRQWEEPALRATSGKRVSLDALTRPVLDSLGQDQLPSYVYLEVPDGRNESVYMYVTGGTVRPYHDVWVNPTSGQWIGAPDEGAVTRVLYYLHFFYQFGLWGLYLAGLVGLFALLAVVTGTVVHLDRLVKDFFQFRPRKKLRVAWADAHKVLGTIGLPFQTMYAFTGAYFGLVGLIALPYAAVLFDGSMAEYYREAGYSAPPVSVDSVEVTASRHPTLDRLAAQAGDTWSDFEVNTLIIHNMGQPSSRVEVLGRQRGVVFGGTGSIVYHGVTGEELLRQVPREAGALNEAVQSMEVLHFADFGGVMLKVLFFLLGVASCAVILTGNLTWLEVRRTQGRAINTVLARLTAGVATGLVPATALMFVADRWMLGIVAHPDWWTNLVFFGSWLLCVVYALVRQNIARTHRTLLVLGGVLALLIPVANGLTTGNWPWVAWSAGRWGVLGVDLGAVLCGLAALGVAACLDVGGAAPPAKAAPQETDRQPREVLVPEEVSPKPA